MEKRKSNRMGKKIGLSVLLLVVCVLLYLVVGGILPYLRQPKVSAEYKDKLKVSDFYGEDVSCDRAVIIEDNGEALKERIRLLAKAKKQVILSTFDFRPDEAGMDMIAALIDTAKRGVQVQILADGFGAWTHMERNPYFYALSAQPNVTLKVYNPVNLLTPWTAMGRMHDKYVIVDEDYYLLGGRNTFGYFLGDYPGHKNYDRDVLVYNTEGAGSESSLYQVMDYFQNIWKLDVCSVFHDSGKLLEREDVRAAEEELALRYESLCEAQPSVLEDCDYEAATFPVNRITLVSNPTGVYAKEPEAFYALSELMKQAKEEVYIHTPYVICNQMMYDEFSQIADGVPKVKLLTNSAANNGNPFASGDYLKNRGKLIDTGIRILEYEGGVSYHGKSIAVDDDIAVVGSFNMDMRSVYLDTELMLVINSEEVNRQLRREFEEYEKEACIILDEDTRKVPDGVTPQEMDRGKKIEVGLIRFFAGWARFLM